MSPCMAVAEICITRLAGDTKRNAAGEKKWTSWQGDVGDCKQAANRMTLGRSSIQAYCILEGWGDMISKQASRVV
jgi:hypothetical protein